MIAGMKVVWLATAKSRGVLFVKRDGQGQLGTLFVQFSFSPTRFGGWRAWSVVRDVGRPAVSYTAL